MRLVHESADRSRSILATDVETADSLVDQTKGLMFRRSVPEDYALVFRFEPGLLERLHERLPAPVDRITASADYRSIHMLFVRVPLDVVWIQDEEVVDVRTLRPWRDVGGASADTVIELAGGVAADVEPGDTVRLVEDSAGSGDAVNGTVEPRPEADESIESPSDSDGTVEAPSNADETAD